MQDCDFFQSMEYENRLVLLEEWDTEENLKAHLESEQFRVLRGAMNLLLKEPYEVMFHAVLHPTNNSTQCHKPSSLCLLLNYCLILILEDNPDDAALVQFELEDAWFVFTPKVVMTEEDFVCGIQEFHPDLILSDYDLPTYNGALALAEARRKCAFHRATPTGRKTNEGEQCPFRLA